MDLHVRSYPLGRIVVIYFEFYRNPFRGFGAPGRGSKFGHSHYFGYWLLQQLVLWYKPSQAVIIVIIIIIIVVIVDVNCLWLSSELLTNYHHQHDVRKRKRRVFIWRLFAPRYTQSACSLFLVF